MKKDRINFSCQKFNIENNFFFFFFIQKREFIGSVFVTFGTLQDAENFFELRRELVFKDGRKLSIKWKREYDENRIGKKIVCLKK